MRAYVELVAMVLATLAAAGCKDTRTTPAPDADGGPMTIANTVAPQPVLNDWFALGSGCRAKFDIPGDVAMDRLPRDPAKPDRYGVTFRLDHFELHATGLPKKLARECAVRLNVNPPPGKRVRDVVARTRLVSSKPKASALTLHSELKLGSNSLGHRTTLFDRGTQTQAQEESIELRAGAPGSEPFPKLACGEPKIIGFDFTWISERDVESESVDARIGGPKTLEIEAELETCSQ